MKSKGHPRGDLLQAYLDGELPVSAAAEVQEHCATCPACQEVIARVRGLREELDLDRGLAEPSPVWPAMAARLAQDRRRPGPAFALVAAAACVAGIVLGIVVIGAPADVAVAERSPAWDSVDGLWNGDGDSGGSLLDVFAPAGPEDS